MADEKTKQKSKGSGLFWYVAAPLIFLFAAWFLFNFLTDGDYSIPFFVYAE